MGDDILQEEISLIVPAWCDPRMRNFVWDASTIFVGMFAVGTESLAYATEEGLMFGAKIDQVSVRWPRWLHTHRGCNMYIDDTGYRLYFTRPLRYAPRLGEDQVTRITDNLTDVSSDIVQLIGGTLGNAALVGSLIGDLVALPGAFMDDRRGRRNGDAVKARLEQVAR
jgi:hypothetical protein